MKKILYITDLYYQAKDRNYYEEDLYIVGALKDYFDVVICHPQNSAAFEKDVDLIVFRNTGGVSGFPEIYHAFRERVARHHLNTFNEFVGKGDMGGKQYLLDLTRAGYAVIPTIDHPDDLAQLPAVGRYVIKPKNGADSIGLEFLSRDALLARDLSDRTMLIQPAVDFRYELSFYFINDTFQYAMYAPDKSRRWALEPYTPSEDELAFARTFIDWNDIRSGIQRVDACKLPDGSLLLVEMEDLNPYLSLLDVDEPTRQQFMTNLIAALQQAAE